MKKIFSLLTFLLIVFYSLPVSNAQAFDPYLFFGYSLYKTNPEGVYAVGEVVPVTILDSSRPNQSLRLNINKKSGNSPYYTPKLISGKSDIPPVINLNSKGQWVGFIEFPNTSLGSDLPVGVWEVSLTFDTQTIKKDIQIKYPENFNNSFSLTRSGFGNFMVGDKPDFEVWGGKPGKFILLDTTLINPEDIYSQSYGFTKNDLVTDSGGYFKTSWFSPSGNTRGDVFTSSDVGLWRYNVNIDGEWRSVAFLVKEKSSGINSNPPPAQNPPPSYDPIYGYQYSHLLPLIRLYSPSLNNHFYTTNREEAESAKKFGYRIEGEMGHLLKNWENGAHAFHRLYNTKLRKHFYTTNGAEAQVAQNFGYRYEGVIGYMAQDLKGELGSPVYRLYNSRQRKHFYTSSLDEANALVRSAGFVIESSLDGNLVLSFR